MFLFSEIFVCRRRRGRLVSWVEKTSLERIRRLLEITKGERNHKILLSMKNLRELGASPFPYIVPVIPRQPPTELVKGEHFTLVDLLKSVPGSSTEAGSLKSLKLRLLEKPRLHFFSPSNHLWTNKILGMPPRWKRRRRREKS